MRVRVFQHVPFEGPANLARWAEKRGFPVATTRLYEGEEPPPLEEFELLVVMGGPMGAGDEALYPWLKTEKRFLEAALGAGKRVLGVCLGAQLLAEVLGGRVYRNAQKEIGWHAVRRGSDADRALAGPALPAGFLAFHWHCDAFDLPPGALHLLASDCTPNQAFECGSALALLCHLEVTPASVAEMVEHAGGEIGAGPYVQSAAEILAAPPERYAALERILAALAGRLVD